MQRSILKPHESLVAAVLRMSDPVASILVGVAAHRASLGSLALPPHFLVFLMEWRALDRAPVPGDEALRAETGPSIVREMRQLVLGWLVLSGIVVAVLFATKTGDDIHLLNQSVTEIPGQPAVPRRSG